MSLRRFLSALVSALAALALAAGPASAATVEIGAVQEISAGTPPDAMTGAMGSNFWTVQTSEGTGSYAVPAGYGVITGWSHSAGGTPGNVTFKVYRATDPPPREVFVVAADTRTIEVNTVYDFDVRIPVQPGDRIGLSTVEAEVAYTTGDPRDAFDTFDFNDPDPPAGTTAIRDGAEFVGFRLDVAARVETDADRDGFGDDTQDRCPTNATTQGPCPLGGTYPGPVATPASPFAGCPAQTANVIRGTLASNSLLGTRFGDRIFAGAGNDTVDGLAGDDCIDLGTGTDRGQGGDGADLISGGAGDDRVTGNDGNDRLAGGASGDRLIGGFGDDRLIGDSGSDRINGERGRDRISGGSSGDRISAGSSSDRVSGDGGGDRINANSGNDSVAGGSGSDRLNGASGRDRVSGASGNDRISARDNQRDRINCGSGRRDRVVADRIDRVARNCERVGRR